MLALKILAGIILLTGFLTVLEAKLLVRRFKLDKKVKLDDDSELEPEEIEKYKFLKATVNVKLVGMLIALPGLVLTLIVFR